MIKPEAPAFGTATLANCEREQIHLAASIQPHGALLVAREPDLLIVQASANAACFLGLSEAPLGRPLIALGGDLVERIANSAEPPAVIAPASVETRR